MEHVAGVLSISILVAIFVGFLFLMFWYALSLRSAPLENDEYDNMSFEEKIAFEKGFESGYDAAHQEKTIKVVK